MASKVKTPGRVHASYLKTSCEEASEPFDPNLAKAQASRRIEELQALTGHGH